MQIDSENGETPTAENNADRRHYSDQERRLMFGYFNADGEWVPGVLETIRDLQAENTKILERMDARERRDDTIERWWVRSLVALVLVRFLGWEHLADLLHFLGFH